MHEARASVLLHDVLDGGGVRQTERGDAFLPFLDRAVAGTKLNLGKHIFYETSFSLDRFNQGLLKPGGFKLSGQLNTT